MAKISTKVKPKGMKILLWGLVILILVNLLARFGVYDASPLQKDILTIIAVFFVATEIGAKSLLKKGKSRKNLLLWFGTAVFVLAFLGVIFGFMGLSWTFLEATKIWVELFLLLYVVGAIFT